MNVHGLTPQPNTDAMATMLNCIFRHALRGKVELAWTSPDGSLNRAQHFDLSDLEGLAVKAAILNEQTNHNPYISAGLRFDTVPIHGRANDRDVEAIAALKADCDVSGCLERALARCDETGIRPNLVVFTGKHPNLRGSLWWVLEEPEKDLRRVETVERTLATAFDSDPKVVNPSRVMRLAGCIAWPFKAGRILEMTGIHDVPTRQASYSLDEIESALRRAGASGKASAEVYDFSSARKTIELEELIRKAAEPHEWWGAMLSATAHLTGRGCPPDVTIDILSPRVTQAGYSEAQTRAELAVMLEGAVRKGWAPAATQDALMIAPPSAGRDPFPLIPYPEIGLGPPPEWRVGGLLPKEGTGILYGPSGTFKSFITLDLALTVASGLTWRGQAVEACGAAYIAGEGTYGIQKRVAAWREHRGREAALDIPFWLAPVASNFLDVETVKLIASKLLPLGVRFIVVDTLARSFGGGDENKAQDMNRFVAACDYLRDACSAFVLAVHHTGLAEGRERGSTVLRGGVDVRLSVTRGVNDMAAVIEVAKQKDEEDGQRFRVRMVKVETVHPMTGEVVSSLVPVMDDEILMPESAPRMGRNERAVMAALLAAHPLKFGAIRAATGIESGNLGRTLRSLFDKGLAIQENDSWRPSAVSMQSYDKTVL